MTLDEKIRDVLARLAVLSEAPAGRPSELAPPERGGTDEQGRQHKRSDPLHWGRGSISTKPHFGSAIPAGVRDDVAATDPNRPPPKDRSLFDWYVWQFNRHQDEPDRLLSLALLAERELLERTTYSDRRRSLKKGELTENDIEDGGAAERASAERIVEWYEGISAREVAIIEYQTEEWVKKARRQHGRRAEDGRPRAEFLDWDDERRTIEVGLLAERMGQKAAAKRLGVDRNTVRRYWPEREMSAAESAELMAA